jgi:DNA-binding transcriptional LysR family regulator
VDLYQLKYFREAARELSFTRAAESLGVSPSAVSRSVALLERSVGRKLFARTRRRVALTVFGSALKARAERIFDEVEGARAELDGGAKAPASLRIASREMITNYLLPGPLAEFKARRGATRFGLFELEPAALAEALKKDQADLGFHYTELNDPAIESRSLGRLTSHLYAARGCKERAFIAPRPFRADPAVPSADGWPDEKRPREILYEAEFLETHRRFVLAGLCAGVLPDLVMREDKRAGRVVALAGPPLHREIFWFKRRGRVLHPAVEELVAGVRRVIRAAA